MAAMFFGHLALTFDPNNSLVIAFGRTSFPIFAYMIAEGCKYTRDRKRYFLMLFGLATACQVVYFLFDGSMYLSILFTFSLSILTVYALDALKRSPSPSAALVFAGTVCAVYALNRFLTVDYGFWGCMVPVFASLPTDTRYDSPRFRTLALGLGLLPLAADLGGIQYYSLLALPLLLLYSGKRGKHNMKYFFYIFYPVHLAVLQGILFLLA